MADLEESTVELVGALQSALEAVENEPSPTADDQGGICASNNRRSTFVEHLKKKGATSARIQGVIKELKLKTKGKIEPKTSTGDGADGKNADPAAQY